MSPALAAAATCVLERPDQAPAGSSRPSWLPSYLPELDGLRGLAVLGVFCYHSHPRLVGTWIYAPSLWGWSGVSLFFVLSGYLITSILLKTRQQPQHYFRNFYARRALRIWPLYFLLIAVCYNGPYWLRVQTSAGAPHWHTLAALLLFVQNLFSARLLGALEPTWSLAIEEQYYFVWAPVVRFVRRPWLLAAALVALLAASPLFRQYGPSVNPTHTLAHLDCIAFGSLPALGLATMRWTRRTWLWTGIASAVTGFAAVATFAGGTPYADSALGLGFAGVVLTTIAGTGARNPFAGLLRHSALRFFGRISYGLYLTHMAVFMSLGVLYDRIDHSSIGGGCMGNLAVVAIQFAICTAVATLLWHGLEKRILRLKQYFTSPS